MSILLILVADDGGQLQYLGTDSETGPARRIKIDFKSDPALVADETDGASLAGEAVDVAEGQYGAVSYWG